MYTLSYGPVIFHVTVTLVLGAVTVMLTPGAGGVGHASAFTENAVNTGPDGDGGAAVVPGAAVPDAPPLPPPEPPVGLLVPEDEPAPPVWVVVAPLAWVVAVVAVVADEVVLSLVALDPAFFELRDDLPLAEHPVTSSATTPNTRIRRIFLMRPPLLSVSAGVCHRLGDASRCPPPTQSWCLWARRGVQSTAS